MPSAAQLEVAGDHSVPLEVPVCHMLFHPAWHEQNDMFPVGTAQPLVCVDLKLCAFNLARFHT